MRSIAAVVALGALGLIGGTLASPAQEARDTGHVVRIADQTPSPGLPWGKQVNGLRGQASQMPGQVGRDVGRIVTDSALSHVLMVLPTLQPDQVSITNQSKARVVFGLGDSATQISRLIDADPDQPAVFTIVVSGVRKKIFIRSGELTRNFDLTPKTHYRFSWLPTLEPELKEITVDR